MKDFIENAVQEIRSTVGEVPGHSAGSPAGSTPRSPPR